MITQRSQQVEAQSKAFAPVAITLAQDAKHLEPRQDTFHDHALARQLLIGHLLFRCERVMLAFLVRRLAVAVPAAQATIAGIGQTAALGAQPQATLLEQRKIMGVSRTKGCRQNPPAALLNDNLCF